MRLLPKALVAKIHLNKLSPVSRGTLRTRGLIQTPSWCQISPLGLLACEITPQTLGSQKSSEWVPTLSNVTSPGTNV